MVRRGTHTDTYRRQTAQHVVYEADADRPEFVTGDADVYYCYSSFVSTGVSRYYVYIVFAKLHVRLRHMFFYDSR